MLRPLEMAPVLDPKSPTKAVAYRGPADLVEEIDRAADELGLSRNEAMTQLLRYAIDAHKKERAGTKKKR